MSFESIGAETRASAITLSELLQAVRAGAVIAASETAANKDIVLDGEFIGAVYAG